MITKYSQILKLITNYNPKNYDKTRNYINGNVSYLSAYLSRGVISTKFIFEYLKNSDKINY